MRGPREGGEGGLVSKPGPVLENDFWTPPPLPFVHDHFIQQNYQYLFYLILGRARGPGAEGT